MIASLPMYDWPEIRDATDAWWAGLAGHLRRAGLRNAPSRLVRGGVAAAVWTHPALLLSQTCGLPLMRRYRRKLQVVATPCYAVDGCAGPTYSSLVLVRESGPVDRLDDLRGAVVAYNATDSLSGHLALRLMLAPLARGGRFLAGAVATGSHAASMAAVGEGRADACAVDCVSYAIAVAHRPALTTALRRIAWSPPMPALPYVTSSRRSEREVTALRIGLGAAMQDSSLAECRSSLLLAGFEVAPRDAYAAIGRIDASTPDLAFG